MKFTNGQWLLRDGVSAAYPERVYDVATGRGSLTVYAPTYPVRQFTTNYDEATVSEFIDGMAERYIPLSVLHFGCFWMRDLN
ncbi:hypothetical protein [Micromonospora deserti]|uniref:hypothetical protein n=1 Tax=Micromonospora deserti TaxID=2070366 RepID=UPI0018F5D9F7|nr:hypothetical protein [Micromonospora deserti]